MRLRPVARCSICLQPGAYHCSFNEILTASHLHCLENGIYFIAIIWRLPLQMVTSI